jgi:hypothetical protein
MEFLKLDCRFFTAFFLGFVGMMAQSKAVIGLPNVANRCVLVDLEQLVPEHLVGCWRGRCMYPGANILCSVVLQPYSVPFGVEQTHYGCRTTLSGNCVNTRITCKMYQQNRMQCFLTQQTVQNNVLTI